MNKGEFVDAVAARLSQDKKAAGAAVDAVIHSVYAAVADGERVSITGFGVFEKRERAARSARNPSTGEPVDVPAMSIPGFRAGAEFKAVTSGAKSVGANGVVAAATAPAKKTAAKSAKQTAAKTPAKATPAKSAATKSAAAKTLATSSSPAKKTTASKTISPSAATKAGAKKSAAKKSG